MELGLILGRNLEKPGKRQNLGVFQGFSRFNFLFLPFSRLFQAFPGFSRFSRSPGNPAHVTHKCNGQLQEAECTIIHTRQ